MKILHLTLKKKWFDMILSGEKKEEYREIKPYWFGRLVFTSRPFDLDIICRRFRLETPNDVLQDVLKTSSFHVVCPEFIEFRNGYGLHVPTMLIECEGLGIGSGNPDWGAQKENLFKFKLGKILETKNC